MPIINCYPFPIWKILKFKRPDQKTENPNRFYRYETIAETLGTIVVHTYEKQYYAKIHLYSHTWYFNFLQLR